MVCFAVLSRTLLLIFVRFALLDVHRVVRVAAVPVKFCLKSICMVSFGLLTIDGLARVAEL